MKSRVFILAAALALAFASCKNGDSIGNGAPARRDSAELDSPLAGSRLPPFSKVRDLWCPSDVRVLDRHGEVLHETRTDPHVRRLAWTALGDVSPVLVRAVIQSEDRRFEEHAGVDWRAVAAAAWQGATGGPSRGASTITMQLAALLDPWLRHRGSPRGVLAKLAQMRAALALERSWSKADILEAWLNLVTFRGEVEGVGAAADAIFAKAPHALSIEESAVLAASVRSPNAPTEKIEHRARVLLRGLGGSDAARIETASARLTGPSGEHAARAALAPHAARLLTGEAPPCRDVASSLDARVQAVAAASLRRHLLDLQDRSASDGAVLVVDNDSGEVLAYVGSTGELSRAPEVDGVRAPRQAGSTLKPFLYALAIERGLVTPATLLDDSPLELAVGDTVYRPANYDRRFRGLVSVRTALASSLNIPAVRTLTLVGEEELAETLRRLGLRGVKETGDWYGPSLALGSVDVTLWDLVGAYRALAEGGAWSALTWETTGAREVANVANPGRGRTPDAETPAAADSSTALSHSVFEPATAWLIADVLADRESRSATFHLDSPLATRYWAAVKTGTSKDMRDNWCVGFSRRFTVGVWVGNFSGEPMHDVSGTTGAAPVWREVVDALHEDVPSDAPAAPAEVVEAWTAFASDAEPARAEWYRSGTEPIARTSGSRAEEPGAVPGSFARPAELDTTPRIVAPSGGSVLALDPDVPSSRQRVALLAHSASAEMRWKLDDRALGSASAPLLWEPLAGSHELELVDQDGRSIDAVRFRVNGPRVSAR